MVLPAPLPSGFTTRYFISVSFGLLDTFAMRLLGRRGASPTGGGALLRSGVVAVDRDGRNRGVRSRGRDEVSTGAMRVRGMPRTYPKTAAGAIPPDAPLRIHPSP